MKISFESHRAANVFTLMGEFTADDEDRFRRRVREFITGSASDVILDCSELSLIDSVGLESLLWLSDELSKRGSKLRLASVSPSVKQVFELTRLERLFTFHESIETAARSFV